MYFTYLAFCCVKSSELNYLYFKIKILFSPISHILYLQPILFARKSKRSSPIMLFNEIIEIIMIAYYVSILDITKQILTRIFWSLFCLLPILICQVQEIVYYFLFQIKTRVEWTQRRRMRKAEREIRYLKVEKLEKSDRALLNAQMLSMNLACQKPLLCPFASSAHSSSSSVSSVCAAKNSK